MYLTAEGKAVTQSSDESFARAFIREVNNDLNDVKHSFIKIGFRLTEANNYEYYKELGYENIIELAEAEFGFKKTTTYELMRVYELAYDRANCMYISKRFDKFTYSQLSVLSYAKYVGSAFWDIVKPTDSVRDLKRFVSNWNEEYKNGCGYHPELKTVKEYLEAYGEKRAEEQNQINEYAGQLLGQIAIDEEPVEEEFSERSENSVQEKEVSETAVAPMTDSELIEHVIKRGSAYLDGKFRIVEFYNSAESPTHEQFKNYVRNDYGSGYFSGDKYYQRVDFNGADGLTITRKTGGQIILAWSVVAGNISRLITADKYLSDEEKDRYLQWKEQRRRLKAEPTQEQLEEEQAEPNEEFSERSEKAEVELVPQQQQPKREHTLTVKKQTIEQLMVAMIEECCDLESARVCRIENELRKQTNGKFYSYHFSDLAEFITETDAPEEKYTEIYCGVLSLLGIEVINEPD